MRRIKPLIHISYSQAIKFASFLVLYEFLTYVSNDMIMPGMHRVIQDFHVDLSYTATSVTSFMLGGSSLQLILGPLADSYGRRNTLLWGIMFFTLTTICITFSQNIHQFIIERFFQGIGICFIGAVGYATIQDIFNDRDAIKLTAIMANVSIIAPLLGPLIGSCIIYYSSWRNIFLLIVILCIYSFWGIWKHMPEPLGQTNTDGQYIPIQPFQLQTIIQNYKTLCSSKIFMIFTMIYSIMGIPCMIWIALSPIMLISNTTHSLFTYALWQIPMFSLFIMANTLLQKIIDKINLDKIIHYGMISTILTLGASYLLILIYGNSLTALRPIFLIYFFTYAITNAPIYRKLFTITTVSKGTSGALISLLTMFIQALGIEIAGHLFHQNNYQHIAIFFLILAIVLGCLYYLSSNKTPKVQSINSF